MRLKISTVHPLSPFKAWFMLDTLVDNVDTISHLKHVLCARLPLGLGDSNITLVMDDYVLLDDSPASILRDGDVVCIKSVPPAVLSTNNVPLPATGKRKRRISTSSESSSSSSSNSSSSDSSSSSDHSSLSSTSTDSDSDSDTDTNEAEPSCQPADKHVDRDLIAKSQDLQKSISLVPPGYGKPSTRNRNLRRRKKRLVERDQSTQGSLAPTSGANAVLPLPVQQTSSEPNAEHSGPHVMMMSLRNKNKKKNFRQLMDKPLPPKIVFTELENAPVSSEPLHAGSSIPAKNSVPYVKCALLIPPSERDDLPSNIFVTSIDVEKGMRPKNKRKLVETPIAPSYDDELFPAESGLDYGSAGITAGVSEPVEALHRKAEQQWDLLPIVTNMSQVEVDSIVAYKGLAINPTTFTPEILTTVARVICLSCTHVTMRPLERAAEVSFRGVMEQKEEGDVEDETHAWADVFSSEWRIVR